MRRDCEAAAVQQAVEPEQPRAVVSRGALHSSDPHLSVLVNFIERI